MTTTTETRPYAITIQQLGGSRKLAAMIGAGGFVHSNAGRTISFSFKGSKKANKARITLDDSDTYTIEFFKYNRRTCECPVVESFRDVYDDMLVSIFQLATGLYLSF